MKAVLIQHCFYEHDDQQEPLGKDSDYLRDS